MCVSVYHNVIVKALFSSCVMYCVYQKHNKRLTKLHTCSNPSASKACRCVLGFVPLFLLLFSTL